MHVTIFSFMMAIIWCSIFAKFATLLGKYMKRFKYFSIYEIFLIFFTCVIRLIFSLELPHSIVLPSKKFLPMLQYILHITVLNLFNSKLDINIADLLITIWIVVASIKICMIIKNYYQLRCILNFLPETEEERLLSIITKVKENCHLTKHTKTIVNQDVKSPAIIGFLSPIIILPDIEFSDDELFAILTHELIHYYYKHALIKCIAGIMQCIFWWNFFFKDWNKEVSHTLEIHADKKVCHLLNNKQQYSYLNAIIKVASTNVNSKMALFSCGLVEGSDTGKLIERFEIILQKRSFERKRTYILILLVFVLVFFSYIFVFQPYYEPQIDSYGEMINVSEDSYLIKTDIGFKLFDSKGNFISDITAIDESLEGLKILKSEEKTL